ncbi:MAG: hypothetical protein NUV98_03130 [Candidatus Roizmanbacteria bacterium]|nr:hypothetical protein [Candidatus Roizmanbacteria bacterium]
MASLTETAFIVRRGIVVGIALIILITFGSIAWRLSSISQEDEVPVPTPTPSVLYGKLPHVNYPDSKQYPTNLELETIEGGPPVSTTSASVYFVPRKAPNLFSRRNAENFAEKLGFTEEPAEQGPTMLTFTDSETRDALVIDIATNNFRLRRNFVDTSVFTSESLPNEAQLQNLAQEYFQSINVWSSSLAKSTVAYYAFQGSDIVEVDRARDAQLARVYFLRPKIGEYPIVTANVDKSETYLLFAADSRRVTTVLEASFQNFPADERASSTYPTISGQQAWEKLVSGEGYVAVPAGDSVTVREGYLAYYQDAEYQSYLQPVYVFEGDGGFVGMVSAIDPLWIGQEETFPTIDPKVTPGIGFPE